jgi:DNA mismatch endonuclease (patch repair protein)
MVRQRRSDTVPEVALRRELHRRGLRYRVDCALPLKEVRRRADIVFTARKVAVFVDGCY